MLCVLEYINQVSNSKHGVRLPLYKERDYSRNFHGSDVASYNLLIWYAGNVAEMNPGSVFVVGEDDEKFRCSFFSLGFNMSVLDGT